MSEIERFKAAYDEHEPEIVAGATIHPDLMPFAHDGPAMFRLLREIIARLSLLEEKQ